MTYSDEVMADAPYIYWKLDQAAGSGAAVDSSGNGINSAPTNLGTYGVAGVTAQTGTAMSCSGVAGTGGVGTGATTVPGLRLTTGSSRSVEMWFKTTQTTANRILATTTGTAQITLSTNRTGVAGGKVSVFWGGSSTIDSSIGVTDGAAHHVVATINATTVTLYVDGVSQGTAARFSDTTSDPALFHGYDSSIGNRFIGTIDEIAWYTTELSADRVAAHYNAGIEAGGTTVPGGQAGETDTAQTGTAVASEQIVAGGQATEADTPRAGSAFEGAPPLATDLNRAGGRTRGGLAVASWEPAVVMPPATASGGLAEHRRIRAAAFGPVTMAGPQPTYTTSEATAPRLRTRVMVGGKDVSFLDDIATPEPEYQLAEPLRWGPSSVELPQIPAAFFNPADHPWLAKGKPVVYQRVDAEGTKVAVDYRGVVVAHDTSGKTLRLEVGGHAQGKAALRRKPLPRFRDTLDLGRLAWAAIRDLGLAFSPRLGPTTGIKQALFGGSDHLTYISELCAKAFDYDGQWTLMPDDAGRYTFARKDRSTVHWTLFNDDARVVADLRSDAAEEPNRIFATGVTPKGQRVMFGVYPGLEQGPAAPYPFADDRTFGLGTTDAETDAGDGITVMLRRLWTAGYLSLEDADGLYDAEVTRAIMSLQDDAGLATTGNMNPATWAALFDLDVTGYTLRGARIEPAAQDYRVRRYNRSSSGAIIGKNPNFDRSRLIVDREIDFGSGFTRHQMRAMSRAEVYRGEDNWFGTITIHGGAVLRGDIAPGATISEADLADVREIVPGQNVGLPMFGGGILLHISGVEITRSEGGHPVARLTVDTQARDAMPVWEMIRRNRETRRDPARRWKGNRASGVIKDSVDVWDEVGGVVSGDRDLVAGWNIIEVVGGQEGTVSRLRLRVSAEAGVEGDPVEFACSITGKKVTAARMNTLVPAPLATGGHKAWEDNDVRTVLKKKWHLYSAGTNDEPCGYSPGRKTDSDPLRGVHDDDAGFSYRTDQQPILYLAIWVAAPAVLESGRVMWPQLEAGA